MEYEIEFRIFFYNKYNFFLNVRLVLVIFLVDYMFKGGKQKFYVFMVLSLKMSG